MLNDSVPVMKLFVSEIRNFFDPRSLKSVKPSLTL